MSVTKRGHEYVYIACRVEDVPVPFIPAVKRKCSICNKDVWVSEWSYRLSQISKIICIHCIGKL